MNMYSCRLPRIWMTIIDCLFYAFDSLYCEVALKYIAKLLVVWLNEPFEETSKVLLKIVIEGNLHYDPDGKVFLLLNT